MIFDQNEEKFQIDMFSEEPQEEAKPLAEAYATGPDGPEEMPLVTFSAKPNEPASPQLDSSPVRPFEPEASAVNRTNKKIIAVGGAKGGVGKSMLSANLAVGLALLGQKVVLADLDLGGADVHLYAGVKSLPRTWNDFLDKKVDSIKDILTPTAFKGLSLIGGDSSKLGSANLPYSQKLKIMRTSKNWRPITWSSIWVGIPLIMDWISSCWQIKRLWFPARNRHRSWTATPI